jgi:UDP-N-acetylglucosamine--N-acetylmuramyl-(pentapeptide) pyrophosphoryl-undecaprenol N-acetylglucosamine transferase
LTGVPLRAGFGPRAYVPRGTARVLVIGGSQGAAALNECVPSALGRLGHVAGVEVLHQAGRGREAVVRAAYAREGVARATVKAFIDDVASAIADADVVVARAGAATLAELTAIGRAAILVPFPHAADDHQGRNAEALARAGGAVCLRQEDADPPRLAREIERLLLDNAARKAMADASRARGRPGAADEVAADVLALAGIALRPRSRINGSGRHRTVEVD